LNDYYDGVEGARRLIKELDQLLQEMLDNVGHAETLNCSIKLTVSGGETIALDKTYRPQPDEV